MTKTYFIYDGTNNAVKIGKAIDPEKRLSELQVGNCVPLELVATLDSDEEEHLHNRFAKLRVLGEWFAVAGELREWLATELGCRPKCRYPRIRLELSIDGREFCYDEERPVDESDAVVPRVWVSMRPRKNGKVSYHLRWIDRGTGSWRSKAAGTDRRYADHQKMSLLKKLKRQTCLPLKLNT